MFRGVVPDSLVDPCVFMAVVDFECVLHVGCVKSEHSVNLTDVHHTRSECDEDRETYKRTSGDS